MANLRFGNYKSDYYSGKFRHRIGTPYFESEVPTYVQRFNYAHAQIILCFAPAPPLSVCKRSNWRATMYACCVVLLLLAIGQGTIGIPLVDFYPFGSEAGDSSLPSNDDGSSGSITLSFTFPFFGTDYRMVYVRIYTCNCNTAVYKITIV